jgi:hypothetical protein
MNLTPNALRLVERFGDVDALADHLREVNRDHAVGHGYRNPAVAAQRMVDAYEQATPAERAYCRAVNARIARELGIR